VLQLLVTANVVPKSTILFNLMMEVTIASEMSVLTKAIQRHIREDVILHLKMNLTTGLRRKNQAINQSIYGQADGCVQY
jgi:hypothetical protein